MTCGEKIAKEEKTERATILTKIEFHVYEIPVTGNGRVEILAIEINTKGRERNNNTNKEDK